MRLFIAAPVPDPIRAGLASLRTSPGAASLPVRWVRPEGIHLTLKFLGEVPAERVEAIGRAVAPAVAGLPPADLEVIGLGAFPPRGRPRVVWAGLVGDVPGIEKLAAAIEDALGAEGFARETRPFRAHLTLGRFHVAPRGDWRGALQPHVSMSFGRFRVVDVVLFESHLQAAGARYRAIERIPLAAGSAS